MTYVVLSPVLLLFAVAKVAGSGGCQTCPPNLWMHCESGKYRWSTSEHRKLLGATRGYNGYSNLSACRFMCEEMRGCEIFEYGIDDE
ncbi:hypothetical protein T265_15844, partial [Opisthorchis viverrini]